MKLLEGGITINNFVAFENSVTNGKAITSLILGILSMLFAILGLVGLILSIIGLICGILGLREIKNLKQKGHKLAVSGMVCSVLGIILQIVGFMIVINILDTVS